MNDDDVNLARMYDFPVVLIWVAMQVDPLDYMVMQRFGFHKFDHLVGMSDWQLLEYGLSPEFVTAFRARCEVYRRRALR